jgi:hypothetical protein
MGNKKVTHSHLIEVDEDTNRIYIYRVNTGGEKHLLTYTDLPSKKYSEDPKGVDEFSRLLGENILLDSPIARKIFDL